MDVPIEIRLPQRLHRDIAMAAEVNGRSINDEIVTLLKSAGTTSAEELADYLAIRIRMLMEQRERHAVEQAIHISRDLWDCTVVARYLKRAESTVRTTVLNHPTFPKPVRLPGASKARPASLYKAREVIAWAESFQE